MTLKITRFHVGANRHDLLAQIKDLTSRPGVISNRSGMWMVLGNTCDFDRDLDECRWTQIAPLIDLGGPEVTPALRDTLRKYSQNRRFYVPPWKDSAEHSYHVVELPLIVAIDKRAFTEAARVQARLSRAAWVLLNACLVRFLARDDGRVPPRDRASPSTPLP